MNKQIIIKGQHDAILKKQNGEIIVAYGYDETTDTWQQGHYFTPYNGGINEQIQLLKKALEYWEENGYY